MPGGSIPPATSDTHHQCWNVTGCLYLQEMNDHEERCRFLQVWLTPNRKGHKPQYGSTTYTKADRHNQLLHILSGVGPEPSWQRTNRTGCIKLHADANVFVSENDAGVRYELELGPSRQAYLVCAEGKLGWAFAVTSQVAGGCTLLTAVNHAARVVLGIAHDVAAVAHLRV